MNPSSTLIYAANLHVGGGVQVATSIIAEMLELLDENQDGLTVWVSRAVDENLQELGVNTSRLVRYRVVDHRGLRAIFSGDRQKMDKFTQVLVIFGPLYIPLRHAFRIVGFAQAWIIYPQTDAYELIAFPIRWLTRFKFWLQKQAFKNSDHLIVELEHARRGLVEIGLAGNRSVDVVHNSVSSVFLQPNVHNESPLIQRCENLTLGFLGRNYPHKNTKILPHIRRLLRERYGLRVRILVTFTEAEWAACSEDFRNELENVGALSVAECPAFYRSLDGVIFPSLLECFSATPLETLAMGIPLFASDRPFVRDVCCDFAIYYCPHSPEDAAECIFRYFQSSVNPERLQHGRLHVLNFSSPKERAQRYLKLLRLDAESRARVGV